MGRTIRVNDVQATSAEEIIRLLSERRQTLAVAESCTGGLIGHMLTEVPGSSEAFLGGVIVYANAIKEKVGVPAEVLKEHGAVSVQTAEALAIGIRRWARSDIGIAVTGIAGPGGATPGKPVGLVYVGCADTSRLEVEQHHFTGVRSEIKRAAAGAALELLKSVLNIGSEVRPGPKAS
jgi:PncC family amidohydrolase